MNITLRNIPDDVIDKVRTLSTVEKRSLNNELLILLEKAVDAEFENRLDKKDFISKSTQVDIWRSLSGKWKDDRKTEKIIEEIYSTRSMGRDLKL